MGEKNMTGVRKERRNGKVRLVIDFRYTGPTGERLRFRRTASVQNALAAKEEAARLMVNAAKTGDPEQAEPPPPTVPTFSEFVKETWRKIWAPRYRPETLTRYEGLLNQGLLDRFGPMRLDQIQPIDIEAYAAELRSRASTRKKTPGVQPWPHTSLLSSILKAAVELKILKELPGMPSHRRKRKKLPKCPDASTVAHTIELATGWLKYAIALAVYAGLRSGEIRALEVQDIDLKNDLLTIRHALSGKQVLSPKDDEERIVPIAPQLRPILVEATKGKSGTERILRTRQGATPTRQNVLSKLNRLQERHGLERHTVHQLRHAFCTQLLRFGADPEVVRVMAGHSDLETTMQYLHGRVEDARKAMIRGAGNLVGTGADDELN